MSVGPVEYRGARRPGKGAELNVIQKKYSKTIQGDLEIARRIPRQAGRQAQVGKMKSEAINLIKTLSQPAPVAVRQQAVPWFRTSPHQR